MLEVVGGGGGWLLGMHQCGDGAVLVLFVCSVFPYTGIMQGF